MHNICRAGGKIRSTVSRFSYQICTLRVKAPEADEMFGSADRDVTRLLVVSTAAPFTTLYCATTISFEHYCKITGLDEQFLFASGLLFFSSIRVAIPCNFEWTIAALSTRFVFTSHYLVTIWQISHTTEIKAE